MTLAKARMRFSMCGDVRNAMKTEPSICAIDCNYIFSMNFELNGAIQMNATQGTHNRERDSYYGDNYRKNKALILSFSRLTVEQLDEAAEALRRAWLIFRRTDQGHLCFDDPIVEFQEMLRQRPAPWRNSSGCLPMLTPAQYYVVWAWKHNNDAHWLFRDFETQPNFLPAEKVYDYAIQAAVHTQQALALARLLMEAGKKIPA
jgi:hypothetical protein